MEKTIIFYKSKQMYAKFSYVLYGAGHGLTFEATQIRATRFYLA